MFGLFCFLASHNCNQICQNFSSLNSNKSIRCDRAHFQLINTWIYSGKHNHPTRSPILIEYLCKSLSTFHICHIQNEIEKETQIIPPRIFVKHIWIERATTFKMKKKKTSHRMKKRKEKNLSKIVDCDSIRMFQRNVHVSNARCQSKCIRAPFYQTLIK